MLTPTPEYLPVSQRHLIYTGRSMAFTYLIGSSNRNIRAARNTAAPLCPCKQEIIMSDAAFSAQTMSTGGQLRDALDTGDDLNRILALAREAGMLITLDGQIGREKYQSVAGSLNAFRRFAQALSNASAQPPRH
jgi:hypothetical protein